MTTRDAMNEEDLPLYFGEWIKHRRQELDLTQEQLAKSASCSVFAIRKIETGDRRPSSQLAELLAKSLQILTENQTTFIKVARGELSGDCLHSILHGGAAQPADESRPTPGNLPRTLTPFIGREPEITTLGHLLQDPQCSLLTIVGPGGIGKTRLAIETAQHAKDLFPDGVWFVPLVSLNSPLQIVPAIAAALDFKLQEPTNPQGQLLRYLRAKRALLVLDNAEHLLEGVGVFTEILEECPQVKLLVTSRERLNLLSEWVFEVQGLPVPPRDQVEGFEEYSSVALFLHSARRVKAGFEIQKAERKWVFRICQIMEGIPLGIELSAAWVGLLSCEEIAREIEHNLDFLSVSMRDLPERHRSLRATLEHSWKLLKDEERLILSRLSVFRGSFRREDAQEICGASLIVLSSLRDKTLLYRTDQVHYALHEIIRQYAGHKLAEQRDEFERVKDKHARYYVQCLADWEKALQSSRQLETFDEMALVIDNLSQGWQHIITHCRPQTGTSSRICGNLLHSALFSISLFYEMRCRSLEAIAVFKESVEYLKTVQDEFEKTEERFHFISVLGHLTSYLGLHHIYVLQYPKACEYLEEAIRMLGDSQSWIERAQAQIMLAAIYYRQGKYMKSAVLHEQSRDVFREAGVRWWYLLSLINLARTYLPLGKHQEAEELCQEAFRLVEPGDMRLELTLRTQFAFARYLQNDYIRAEQLMQDNLQLSYQYRNHRITANILIDLSKVAIDTGRIEIAEKYLQESIILLNEFGESDDLAYALLHLGKCLAMRFNLEAARLTFRQAIKIGKKLDMFYLVYWGLVNIARIYLTEGKTEKALKILLVLRDYPVEYKEAQDESDCLLADLQAVLSIEQVEGVMKQVNLRVSTKHTVAEALAYALELVT